MNTIKLYPVQGLNKGEYCFFDAGADVELDVNRAGGRAILLGNVRLASASSSFKKVDCHIADYYTIREPSSFEIVSTEAPEKFPYAVWCLDPRLLMIWFVRFWFESKIDLYDLENNLEKEHEKLREEWLGRFPNLVNPLPSMEEAADFLKTNDLTRESKVWVSPETYVDIPPKFQALFEEYKRQ